MESLGLKTKAKQESYREKWSHDLAHEITFDTVPGLPTYMEIDCTSEANLNKLIEMLHLDKAEMRFGAFDATYEEYYGIEKDVITPFSLKNGTLIIIYLIINIQLFQLVFQTPVISKPLHNYLMMTIKIIF